MAKKYDDEDGVWRTIGGRRVFIRNGQSLSEAMKESGKFKSSKKENNVEKNEAKKELTDKEINSLQHEARKLRNEAEKTTGKDSEEAWKKFDDINDKLGKDRIDKNYSMEFYNGEIEKISKMESLDDRKEAIRRLEERTGADRKVIQDTLDEKDYDKHLGEEYERRFGKGKDPYDDPESEESQRLQSIQSRYDDYLQKTEGRGASYGEISYVDNLRGKELDDFEKELDDFEENEDRKRFKNKYGERFGDKTDDMFDYISDPNEYAKKKTTNENQITNALKNKAYQNYMKQHPNSDMTLEEFKNGTSRNKVSLTNNEIKRVKTQKSLKELIDDNKATDITTYDDKKTKALRDKHGHLEAVKITKGTYGMNGALLRSSKTGEYFVITSRNSNLFYWV